MSEWHKIFRNGPLFEGIDAFNVDHVARLDAVLLATCFENCVCHCYHC